MAVTLWVLIFLGSHSYPTVSGIATQQECERLYREIKSVGWANSRGPFSEDDHRCLSYQGIRP